MKWLMMLALMTSLAHAGQGGGNGGGVIVCRHNGPKLPITRVEVLDLFEGRILYKRFYDRNLLPEQYFARVSERLNEWPDFKTLYLNKLDFVIKHMTLIAGNTTLSRTNDVEIVVMENDCEYAQLANYTSIGEIFVNEGLYYLMGDLNKSALVVHEAIYALLRGKSDYVEKVMDARRLTGQLLAEKMNKQIVDDVMARYNAATEIK